jgi:hypothetical protein
MKKKLVYLIMMMIIFVFIWTNVLFISMDKQLSRALDVRIPADSTLVIEDSHGGFHNDGVLMVRTEFEGEKAKEIATQIKKNQNWKATPLPKNIRLVLYGGEMGNNSYYVSDLAQKNKLPEISEGYWLFMNRKDGKKKITAGEELFSDFSANYTVGLYDTKTNSLYYFESDS